MQGRKRLRDKAPQPVQLCFSPTRNHEEPKKKRPGLPGKYPGLQKFLKAMLSDAEREGIFERSLVRPQGQEDPRYLDLHFFTRVSERQRTARDNVSRFFRTLAGEPVDGTRVVRTLSPLADQYGEAGLYDAYTNGRLKTRHREIHEALRDNVRSGWKECGQAFLACKKLQHDFPDEKTSFVEAWLSSRLLPDEPRQTGDGLTDRLNLKLDSCLTGSEDVSNYDLWNRVRDAFIKPLDPFGGAAHLRGVGEQMLAYFFRGWRSVKVNAFMFKDDSTNKDFFWPKVFAEFQVAESERGVIPAAAIICANLERKDFLSGALAKLNAHAYWLTGASGWVVTYMRSVMTDRK